MQKRKFTHTQHWTVKNAAVVRTSCGDRESAVTSATNSGRISSKQKHKRRPDEYLTAEMLLVLGSPTTRRQQPLHSGLVPDSSSGSGLNKRAGGDAAVFAGSRPRVWSVSLTGLAEPLLVPFFSGLVIKAGLGTSILETSNAGQKLGFVMEAIFFLIKSSNL
ncbi:hypothetical protein OROHE_000517 [Orobanche hederae]